MTPAENAPNAEATVEDIQKGWHDLTLRVAQLEVERSVLEHENKSLRFLLERVIEHRQKSHGELVLLLTTLVSKLPINDVGVVVARLVEHNASVSEICAGLAKGKAEANIPQPSVLKALDQVKRELAAALKPLVEELVQLEAPFEAEQLRALVTDPETFFSPAVVRANRGFVKGQLPRDRVVKEFGEEAVIFFNDMTTDAKLNPRPKPEEIMLAFRTELEELLQQNPAVAANKRQELTALNLKIQASKASTAHARAQRTAFNKLSFILELLHYYNNQSTEAPDVIYAQRLPALVEQLVVAGPHDPLDEKAVVQAEQLLAFIINPDHRLMVVNNMGKSGGAARTAKYVLRLRGPKGPDQNELVADFVRHLVPSPRVLPQPQIVAAPLRLLHADVQKLVARALMSFEKIRRDEAEALGRAVGKQLGLVGLEEEIRAQAAVSPEVERQMAWERVKDLIVKRGDPAAIAAGIRDRLHHKYDADEVKHSWLLLTEADPMLLIRTFCQLPYLPDGSTDSMAHTVMATYTTRLTHEKYAGAYNKVVNSLRNMYKAKHDSPTLVNFLALVRWVDPEAANKLSADIGIPAHAH